MIATSFKTSSDLGLLSQSLLCHSPVIEHDNPQGRGRLRLPIGTPFREELSLPAYHLVERDTDGQMGGRFYGRPTVCPEILGGLRAGRAFALEFQQIILSMLMAAKSPKGPTSYSGIEAGFLLTVGELCGGVTHIQNLLQNHDTRARWTRVVDEIAAGRYTPDDWEFGV